MEKFEKDLHREFLFYGENARKWMRKCELLLPKIEKYRIWEKKGFSSIYVYAYKLAGMSQRKVNECLRVMRKIEDKPELRRVAEEKGLNAVRPVATIATEEDQRFWAEKADKMSMHTLETYVKDFRGSLRAEKSEKKTIMMQVDSEVAEELEKLKGQEDWNTLMKELLELRKEGLEKPESKKANSRAIPVKIKRYVQATTNGVCCFPGCMRKSEIFHHTDRISLSKEHDPDKIKLLCKAHHDIAHMGLIENEEKSVDQWKIRREKERYEIKNMIDEIVQVKKKPT